MSESGKQEIAEGQPSSANEEESSEVLDRYLSFSLGNEDYAIPLLSVKEVMGLPEVTQVPQAPSHFLGVMNLRGQVISVIDLRLKLGMKVQALKEMAVIICDLQQTCVGIVVDSVNSVISPPVNEIQTKPEIKSSRNSDYISGIYKGEKRVYLFLNLNKALGVEELIAKANSSMNQK